MPRSKQSAATIPSATNLPAPPRDDQNVRMKRYFISMTVRTVCFVLAVVLHGWMRWTCVGLAVILPYVAVVLANATNRRRIDVLGSVIPADPPRTLHGRHH